MIFFVLLGAEFFNSFIALTQLPNLLTEFSKENNLEHKDWTNQNISVMKTQLKKLGL